jgi:hypothetical protein
MGGHLDLLDNLLRGRGRFGAPLPDEVFSRSGLGVPDLKGISRVVVERFSNRAAAALTIDTVRCGLVPVTRRLK